MEKNLLETIEENDEKVFDIANGIDDYNWGQDNFKEMLSKMKIEELEALLKVVWKKYKPWGGDSGKESDRQIYGYNEAIFDIVNLVKETIKKLKEDNEKI